MKGNNQVINVLNQSLSGELAAINQYMIHSSILEDIGHPKLAKYVRKQAIDEMHHAETLIKRILFLEGDPRIEASGPILLDKEPEKILETQRKMEAEAVEQYQQAASTADKAMDYVTRKLFEELLEDEEEHFDWLDTQIGLIQRLGFANYEASLIDPTAEST